MILSTDLSSSQWLQYHQDGIIENKLLVLSRRYCNFRSYGIVKMVLQNTSKLQYRQ